MARVKQKPKPSWEKADEEHKVELSNYLVYKLGDIEIPDCIGCTIMMMILNGTVLKS